MKTLKLIATGIFLFLSSLTQAQVSINVNIGKPPSWGPAGYSNVDYYYLPDIQAYYDIRDSQFIYLNGGVWIHSRNLPRQYRNYDLYNGYKVVLTDYHGAKPYTYFKNHRTKYYRGYKGSPQRTIGNRNDYSKREKNDKWNNGDRRRDNKYHRNNEKENNEKENRGRGNDKH